MTSSIFFGDFEVTPGAYELRRGGEVVHVEPKVFELLVFLLENRDRVVPKRELIDRLWSEEFVTDSALSRAVRDLRRALGDTGSEKRWIQTVYGRGLRFRGEATEAKSAAEAPDLLERDDEIERLGALLAAARRESGRLALVAGEAGIGKTALLEAFVGGHVPTPVLWGSCDALFTPRPLGPVQDFAAELGGEVAGLIASAAPRDSILRASLEALEGAPKPCVVVLEDLHWADEATLDWLKFVGRRLPRLHGLLLLASYRDDEVGAAHPLRSVLGDLPLQVTERLFLRPLSKEAVRALAETAERAADGLWEATRGNPFFVTEALSAAVGEVPVTVRDAVVARAARLSPAARDLLDVASVVPTRLERWLLSRIASDERAIDECLDSGVLRLVENDLSFRHELARLALEEELAPHRRRELHRRVFQLLREQLDAEAEPARLVHHAAEAGDTEAVLRLAPRAAEQAAALGAHREAAAHYRTALESAASLPPEARAALFERFSYECYLTDQIDEALAARTQALELWTSLDRPDKRGESLRWLSRLLWFVGRNPEARARADEAVAALEPVGGRQLAMAYSNRSQLHMLAQESRRAVEWGNRAIELARRLDDREILAHALNNVGTAEALAGDRDGLVKLEESLSVARAERLHEHVARAFTNLGSIAVSGREYARAGRWLDEGIAYCVDRDLDSWVDYMLAWKARLELETGRWQRAAEDALRVVRRPGVAAVSQIPALAALAAVRVRRGDPGAHEALERGRALAEETGELQRIGPVAVASAEAAWWRGDTEALVTELTPVLELARRHPHPWVLGELHLWMWRAGSPPERRDDLAAPYALEIDGDWRAAAAAWEEIGCPYEAALARAGADDETARREALAVCERLGAQPAARAIRARLERKSEQ